MSSARFCSENVNQYRYRGSGLHRELLRRALRRQNLVGREQSEQVIASFTSFVMTLRRRKVEPDIRAHAVFLHALTLAVHDAKPELRLRIAFAGSTLEPLPRTGKALKCSTTIVIHRAELRLRCNEILFCRPRDPLPRERRVTPRTGTIEMSEPQFKLRLGVSPPGVSLKLRSPDDATRVGVERSGLERRRLYADGPRQQASREFPPAARHVAQQDDREGYRED